MASKSSQSKKSTESGDTTGTDNARGTGFNVAPPEKSLAQSIEDEVVSSTIQDFTCTICLEIWDYPTKMADCKHLCCLKCAVRHIQTRGLDRGTCPSCRRPFWLQYQVDNKARKIRDLWLERNPGYGMKEDRRWP
ncbi:hypothetical protein RUND412_001792 [Rhizina undulata]